MMHTGIKLFFVLLYTAIGAAKGYSLQLDKDTMAVRSLLDSNGMNTMPVRLASDMVDGRIYKLELFFCSPMREIAGRTVNITYDIGALTALVMLNLSGNGLADIPAEIGNLRNLTHLSLYKNSLERIPGEIGYLSSLRYLWLQDNALKGLPAQIGNLKSLEYLYLYNNQLETIPPQIGDLVSLKELFLNENNLNSLPPEIAGLGNCMVLNVKGNSLKNVPGEIGRMTSLCYLDLSDNDLTTLPDSIAKLRPVIYCDLGYNRLDPANLSDAVKSWADFYDPYWQEKQNIRSKVVISFRAKPLEFSFIVLSNALYYNLPEPGMVRIQLYNTHGRLITTLLDAHKQKGPGTLMWNRNKYGAGIYYLNFFSKDNRVIRKVIVMK